MKKIILFLMMGMFSIISFESKAQSWILFQDVPFYEIKDAKNIVIASESIPHIQEEYKILGKERPGYNIVDSNSYSILCSYIIKNGELLSYNHDVDAPVYYVSINKIDDSYQLYFKFYNNYEIVSFFNSLISFMKNKKADPAFIELLERFKNEAGKR